VVSPNLGFVDDINADGADEMYVMQRSPSSYVGSFGLFTELPVSASVPVENADVFVTGTDTDENYGLGMATGDFDGNGNPDLLVGGSGYGDSAGLGSHAGRAEVFLTR
jgi:hypothetical protein